MNRDLLYKIIDAYIQGVPIDEVRPVFGVELFKHEYNRCLPGVDFYINHVKYMAQMLSHPSMDDMTYIAGYYAYHFHEQAIKNEADKLAAGNAEALVKSLQDSLDRLEKRKKLLEKQLEVADNLMDLTEETEKRILASMLPLSGFLPGAKVRFKDKKRWGTLVYKIWKIEVQRNKPSGVGVWISADPNPFDLYEFVLYKPKWYDFARR